MKRYSIRLKGPGVGDARVSGAVMRDVLDFLIEGTRRSVRLLIDGRSATRGSAPSWLEPASAIYVLGLSKGSAVIEIEAPSLTEAAPERFSQLSAFIDYKRPGLDYLEETLRDAMEGKEDSEKFDEPLLAHLEHLSGVFRGDVELLQIHRHQERGSKTLEIEPGALQTIRRLRRKIPRSRRVRIAGKLDQIRHSDLMFTLVLESGQKIRGVAEGVPVDELKEHFGQIVVLSGSAVFRPSGGLLRVEADNLDEAKGDVSIWSVEPRPLETDLNARTLRRPQGAKSGINAIIGHWPGNESDEIIESHLRELS